MGFAQVVHLLQREKSFVPIAGQLQRYAGAQGCVQGRVPQLYRTPGQVNLIYRMEKWREGGRGGGDFLHKEKNLFRLK